MKNNSLFITIIVAIIVGAAAFFGGMKYQSSKSPSGFGGNGQFGRNFAGQGANGQRRGNFGGGVNGQITSQDDNSITVKMQDGSSKIVILSGSTAINKQATGTKADLKTGERVAVFGTTNSDGSVTAQNIQLNPMIRVRPSGTPPTNQ